MSKILFIEDDYITIDCIVTHLELSGHDVHVCDDPSQALCRLRFEEFSNVFLDVMLPPGEQFTLMDTADGRYTGLRLLELIHEDEMYRKAREMQWVLITNWRDEPEVESVADNLGVCIMRKPLTISEVEELISK